MKFFVSFLFGMIMLAVVAAMAVLGGRIFDASRNFSINSVIFQPADLSRDRTEQPIALDVLSDEFLRNSLIKKYVYEYFYILPDSTDMKRRRSGMGALARMSDASAFKDWNDKFAPDMEKLADQGVLRRVAVNSITRPQSSEYFQVSYDLMTFDIANDITRAPRITKDKVMFIRLDFEKGLRQIQTNGAKFDIQKELRDGGDPATIFRFRVMEVVVR
jgi:hypothetical protein